MKIKNRIVGVLVLMVSFAVLMSSVNGYSQSPPSNTYKKPVITSAKEPRPYFDEAQAVAGLQQKGWWTTVQKNIQEQEYYVTYQKDTLLSDLSEAYHAANRAQNLRTYFTQDGIRVIPRTKEDPSWQVGLLLEGYCRGNTTTLLPQKAKPEVDNQRITFDRGAVAEWYENRPEGLEQGFTIHERPKGEGEFNLILRVNGDLYPVLSDDGQAIDFYSASGTRTLHYSHLYVIDSQERMLSSHFELSDNVIKIVVDEKAATYPIIIDPLLTYYSWMAQGNQSYALLGYSVSTAGDVNGDGYSDIVVGAQSYDAGYNDVGAAFVYYGSANGLPTQVSWRVYGANGPNGGSQLGASVANAGDVNNDGFADIIIGASWYEDGDYHEGGAFAYYGSASGLGPDGTTDNADWMVESNNPGSRMGVSVDTAGDVNGDGYSDVIVGAEYFSTIDNEGKAFVYHGSASGLSATPSWTAVGSAYQDYFGQSVSTAGDVNGDGYSDVVVGAYLHDNGQTNEGKIYVYHGSSSGLSPGYNWSYEQNVASAKLGKSVSTAGDVNGDGYSDIIVGLPGYPFTFDGAGLAFIFHGSATGLNSSWNRYLYSRDLAGSDTSQLNANFGCSVSTVGDVNGDGYSDVIVGAYLYDAGQTNEGQAYLYHGSASGVESTCVWIGASNNENSEYGYSVANAGDVNGDGFSDVVIGARYHDGSYENGGAAYVYYGIPSGLSSTPNRTYESNQGGAQLGYSVASAGDVNRDGYSDVIVGAPQYDNGTDSEGRAYVYHGSSSGLSASYSWVAESDSWYAAFGSSVSTAGDVNGDGYSDVVVGAPASGDYALAGRIYIYHGSASGLSTSEARLIIGDTNYDRLGSSVSSAGDVNGDGFGDVIAGAPHGYDAFVEGYGKVYVYYGAASGIGASANWIAENNQIFASFGISVASAGDVNGDGFSDIVIGDNQYFNDEDDEGGLFVYYGSITGLDLNGTRTSGTVQNADWTAESDQSDSWFGKSVDTAGDVNGDGYSDIIVGASLYTYGQENEGRAFIYHGSPTGLDKNGTRASGTAYNADRYMESNFEGASFGCSVSSAGDVDGDGFGDVIVGAFTYGSTGQGRAYLYNGSSSGINYNPTWTSDSGQDYSWYGYSVNTAGDVNGDGFSDVIVGSPYYDNGESSEGYAFVYYGNQGSGLRPFPRQLTTSGSIPINLLGKSDSETSFRITAIGRAPMGRSSIQMEWEVKPVGVPFDGTETFTSVWRDTVTTGYSFNELVPNLIGHTAYHWRVRFRYPVGNYFGQPFSRWYEPFPGKLSHIRTNNTVPIPGFVEDYTTPADQITQSDDGNGIITIRFRIRDAGRNICSLTDFWYAVGGAWVGPLSLDHDSLGGGWPDNGGIGYDSEVDWTGTIHSFTFDTQHPDVAAAFANAEHTDVQIAFRANDGVSTNPTYLVSDFFSVDSLPPATGSITIIDNGGYTNDPYPETNLSSTGAAWMRFAFFFPLGFEYAEWVEYEPVYNNLDISTNGDISVVVLVQFMDAFGNIQPAYTSDTTTYDTTPPMVTEGSIIIVDNEGYTRDSTPDLQLYAIGAHEMRFARSPGSFTDTWVPYDTSYSDFNIGFGGDGEKTVWVQYRDHAGNVSIASADQTIYDTTPPPPGWISIDYEYCSDCDEGGDSRFTSDASPAIYLSGLWILGTEPHYMRFEVSPTEPNPFTSGWNPYDSIFNFVDLSVGGEGMKTVWSELKDRLDNVQTSSHASDSIYYDPRAPVASIDVLPEYASGGTIPLTWSADDGSGSGVAETTLYYKRGHTSPWNPLSLTGTPNTFDFTNLTGDGDYYFALVSVDNLGNQFPGPPVINNPDSLPHGAYHVLYETAKPQSEVTHIALDDVADEFTITYTADDAVGNYTSEVARVDLWGKGPFDTAYNLVDTDTVLDGVFIYQPEDLGAYHFYTIATDRAGNEEDVPAQGYDMVAIYSDEFAGYAIIAVGSVADGEGLASHTQTANHIYAHLINRNFALIDDPVARWDDPLDLIKYFNPYSEPQPGEDHYSEGGTVSYWDALRRAVTEWAPAKMRVRSGPLYLILVDHGTPDTFHLTGTQFITPTYLDQWLDRLELDMAAEGIDEHIVVVLGTCYSGSFIDELSEPGKHGLSLPVQRPTNPPTGARCSPAACVTASFLSAPCSTT